MTTGQLAVVKLGGGVLGAPADFAAAIEAVGAAARRRPIVVVPGGGPFADTVRAVDRAVALPDDTAHWMAVLAMEQYAHLLAARLGGAVLVDDARGVQQSLAVGALPVLAPYRWLRAADPLPHAWAVTSDSIAAWVAAQLGATTLVLVKPAGAAGEGVVDPYFTHALPAGVRCLVVPAERAGTLASLLDEQPGG